MAVQWLAWADDHYPEGTVWIGVAGPEGSKTFLYQWNKDRKANIRRFADVALRFLEQEAMNYVTN